MANISSYNKYHPEYRKRKALFHLSFLLSNMLIMKEKRYLLFDADNTLDDFSATEKAALNRLFGKYGISTSLLPLYHAGNRECWERYEQGGLTLETLETERFRLFTEAAGLSYDAAAMGTDYSQMLGEAGIMIPGAISLLETLTKEYSLSLITNGIASVQKARIRGTDTGRFFDHVFISQEIGYAKPDSRFFSHVLSVLDTCPEQCLVIGDSLTSDIKGAANAGIDSVFISFDGKTSEEATWSVASYEELLKLLDD